MPEVDLSKFIEAEKWRRELQSQRIVQEAKTFLTTNAKFNDIKQSTVVCLQCEIGDRLLEQIIAQKADCVLIGSRGLTPGERTVMGSLSNYVVQYANIPVIVCKRERVSAATN